LVTPDSSLTAHPKKDALLLFGGELNDGRHTKVFGDLLLFYPNKAEWRRLTLPNPPPPRSAHQAWATGGGDAALFVFGGEFTSPNGSSFYHYSDFWKLPLGVPLADMAWEKIEAPGGPSPRSGHRMTMFKRKLVVVRRAPPARTWRLRRGGCTSLVTAARFSASRNQPQVGGFQDNNRSTPKYFNDVWIFDLEKYAWSKVAFPTTMLKPDPRSGVQLVSAKTHASPL
jgi:hypothetical protein